MEDFSPQLLSGNEAVALAAKYAGIRLGTGYPGTPSTEILENFSAYGGRAQWAPNEKVALEVGLGAAFGGARALVTMKHVGVNVAADALFTAAYTGVTGALVVVSADDPGMASSQNEQDNRRYAIAAGVPMIEPADSQEAFDFLLAAVGISERWSIPVLFRMTTRICHSKTVVTPEAEIPDAQTPHFERDLKSRVMIPAFARPAHQRLRTKLDQIREWNESAPFNHFSDAMQENPHRLAIITSGVAFMHAREAAPEADIFKLGITHPLPLKAIERFSQRYDRCVVIEEGDPVLATEIRAQGIAVEAAPEPFQFGELNVSRVRQILDGTAPPEIKRAAGKPPQLCAGCPHREVFSLLHDLDCIVAGDIGCYSLGVLPPFTAMDTCVCMGASVGVGLGLRHVLPEQEARRVVSVIGDSTFMHTGVNGLIEMAYNRPPTGHVVMILDNQTTAMTGLQEHPATGRLLDHSRGPLVSMEAIAKACGMDTVEVIDPQKNSDQLRHTLEDALQSNRLTVIITRRPCVLAAGKIRQYEKANQLAEQCQHHEETT